MKHVRGVWSGRLVRPKQEPCALRCVECGILMAPRRGPGRSRLYHSAACKQRAYRRRKRGGQPRTSGWYRCVWCGKAFTRKSAYGPAPRFCSEQCTGYARRQRDSEVVRSALRRLRTDPDKDLFAWAIKRYRLGAPLPVCPVCGDIFYDEEGRPGRPRVYCSDRCRWHAHDLRWRECPVCHTWFDRTDANGRLTRRYCSLACRATAGSRRRRGQPIADWQTRSLPGHESAVEAFPSIALDEELWF